LLKRGADDITVCSVASSYRTDVKEMYSTDKCVKLFCDMIERFIDEDKNVQIHMEVIKVKNAHI
jgi:hypothetical protein